MNTHLQIARKTKADEYYTLLEDIGRELVKYIPQLRGKVVYCNCDDEWSAFVYFFITYFHIFGLKKLYCTGIEGKLIEYDGHRTKKRKIDGDFRSPDCHKIRTQSDILITNPAFSLFRQWINFVDGKDFLVIANKNAVCTKEFFPLIKNGSVKIGYTTPKRFYTPDGTITERVSGLCRWFTTLDVAKSSAFKATCNYDSKRYMVYDYYPAIEVGEVANIPCDYEGLMGVPITFLDHINYNEYEIVDLISRYAMVNKSYDIRGHELTEVNGKTKYSRLIIKRK